MHRTLRVAVMVGALAAPGVAAQGQDRTPPPARSAERAAPPTRVDGGRSVERAVPRAAAPAPRAESPRADQGNRRGGGGNEGQSRARSAPPSTRSGGGGQHAVPRTGAAPRSGGSTARSGGADRSSMPMQAVPRDRGGLPSYGTATARRYPPYYGHGGGGHYPYHGWNYYYPYFPLTYGFFWGWDPWFGYGYPYYGYPYYGYPYGGYGGYGYYGGGGGGGYTYSPYAGPRYEIYGAIRLKVKPRQADVFVDGYFAGKVDDFDGAFQQLNLDVGHHKIELRANGYETISFDVRTQPDEKITYKAQMKPTP